MALGISYYGYWSLLIGLLCMCCNTAQNMKFSIKDFFSTCDQIPADLLKFTEEFLNGKLHF